MYIRSNESNLNFPEKKAWHFKVHLKSPLIFDGKWTVTLLEFQANAIKTTPVNSRNQTLFIYSNIWGDSIVKKEHFSGEFCKPQAENGVQFIKHLSI